MGGARVLRGKLPALRDGREVSAIVGEDFLEYLACQVAVLGHDQEAVEVTTSGGADVEAPVGRGGGDDGQAHVDRVALMAVGGCGVAEPDVLARVVGRERDLPASVFVGHGEAAVAAKGGDCPAVAIADRIAAVGS